MSNSARSGGPNFTGMAVGAILVLLGIFFLFTELLGLVFNIHLGQYFWPFFIIVPGAALLLLGLLGHMRAGEPLAMIGAMVTMTGLLLFFQNLTHLWASWSYAWALIAPTSLGLGQLAYGLVKGDTAMQRTGMRLATIGFIIFLVAGVFFELIIGVSGFGLGRWGWSLLLIAAGIVLLLRAILPGRRGAGGGIE
jgi:hypothetical protein